MNKPAGIEDIYSLSPLQEGLLFHTLLDPDSGVYIEQLTCELHGQLDEEAFHRSWQLLIDRHPILRTAFIWKGQREPVQVVHRKLPLSWRKEDWRHLHQHQQKEQLETFLAEDRTRGFELNRAPLLRIVTIQLSAHSWQLVSTHHHLLLDGWSFPLLLREFGEAYRTFSDHKIPSLPPAPPYSSYIAWLRRRNGEKEEAFWREQLLGFSAPTPLALEKAKQGAKQFADAALLVPARDTALLQARSREWGVTVNTLLQGAYALLLSRYGRTDDVVFGVTVAGRPPSLPGVEAIVGLFINSLPFRVRVNPNLPAESWLRALADQQLAIGEFEHCSLSDIQKWSDIPGGQPLFESLFVFENYPVDQSLPDQLGALQPRSVVFREHSHFPLTLIVIPGERLCLKASYDLGRFDASSIERLLSHLHQAALALAGHAVQTALQAGPNRSLRLGSVEFITPSEKAALLPSPLPSANVQGPASNLHEWFRINAKQRPGSLAVSCQGEEVTYIDLDVASSRLANHLVKLGVRPGGFVGLFLDRGIELIVGLLGILKAGAAYVPLDPNYPDERLLYIAADSGIQLIVTSRGFSGRLAQSNATLFELDAAGALLRAEPDTTPQLDISPHHPAYVIYTSGSTGRPKGCVISHGNVLRLFQSTEGWFAFTPSDVWTLFHSSAFDFSVWEIWGALLYGGRLVVVPYYTSREPEAFYELLARERVTVLNQTPSAFAQLMHVDAQHPSGSLALRYVIFGGEALDLFSLRPWFARHGDARPQLINMYGITETTVHVTFRRIFEQDAIQARGSLIGQPIPDLRLLVLDAHGHLCPVGIAGELFVAGAGLAPGYLGRPDLTAERFLPDPFGLSAGGRLYRTGDLARRLPDGDVEYLGRVDDQVKIRGFRIELGEIESELAAQPAVASCAVVARRISAGEHRLTAYAVSRSQARPSSDELRAWLSLRLPSYMIPSAFVWLDRLPVTPHGKVDRKALVAREETNSHTSAEFVAPRNDREALLCGIWEQVLGVPRVGVTDNYFSLGGDSIRSLALRSKARDAGFDFSLQDLFEKQTVERLLATPTEGLPSHSEDDSTPVFSLLADGVRNSLLQQYPDLEDAYPLTRLQLGMLFHSHEHAGSSRYLDTFSFHLEGPLDEALLQQTLDTLVARHAILRTSFDLAASPEPVQLVHRRSHLPLTAVDLSNLPPVRQEEALDDLIQSEAAHPIAWQSAPLIRAYLHRRGPNRFQITLSVHHAILDGWSVASLLTEWFNDYLHRLGNGGRPPLTVESSRFRDYVRLEREAAGNQDSQQFWAAFLSEATPLSLPKPRKAGQVAQERHRRLELHLSSAAGAGLLRLAERLSLPLKSVLLAAHVRVIASIAGQEDVLTGLVSNGRPEKAGAEHVAGLFLNVLPFRLQLPGCTWAELAKAVFEVEKKMLPHRRVPLADIQRHAGIGPLLQTDFNFVNFHVFHSMQGLDTLKLVDTRSTEETNFAIAVNFSVHPTTGMPAGSIAVDAAELDESVTAVLPALYEAALEALAISPDAAWKQSSLFSLPPLSDSLGLKFESTAPDFDDLHAVEELLPHLVEACATEYPDRTAVSDDGTSLTYADLDRQSNQLAHWLLQQGIALEDRVAVALERSVKLPVVLLAILKTGAAYVPIDPSYPVHRIQSILSDSGAALLVAEKEMPGIDVPKFASLHEAWPDVLRQTPDSLNTVIHPGNAAYVIYTSGSTGVPKGVVVPHSALANHMAWMAAAFPLKREDAVLQKTPVTFDASVWEFWAPLLAGARLVMAKPEGHRDPAYLAGAVEQHRITTLQLVPSMLDFFLEHAKGGRCQSLQRVFSGGEVLRDETKDRFYRNLDAELVNLYGPTEVTIDSTYAIVNQGEEVSIGVPIRNVQAYVLDPYLSPLPPGIPGELYLSGNSLARGYLNRPDLTAESFLPDPFSPWAGSRMYRTGDRVRVENGKLIYLGRLDDQVKIRGHRVEPAEVEALVSSFPGVERAVVIAGKHSDESLRLLAYVLARSGESLNTTQLLSFLRARLPAALLPSKIIPLDRLPLTPSGKIDRRNLPRPDLSSNGKRREVQAPSTPVETLLAKLWIDVLGVGEIGLHDNFFELGGDSIQSLRFVSMAAQHGWRLRPKQLFDHPTIAELAQVVEGTSKEEAAALVEIDASNIPLLPIQEDFFALKAPNPHRWNQAVLIQTSPELSPSSAESAWTAVVSRHPAFRLRFSHERAGWRQTLTSEIACPFAVVDARHFGPADWPSEIANSAEHAHRSLNISRGPLIRSVFFHANTGATGRWLIVAHHLCIDGVSWRILLEELSQACSANPLPLAAEDLSFPQWSVRLQHFLQSGQGQTDASFWQSTVAEAAPLPLDFAAQDAVNTESSTESVTWSLPEVSTAQLLRAAPQALRASTAELLLTALSAALGDWAGGNVLADVEGHGRDEAFGGGQLAHTVGWFTSVYPMRLPGESATCLDRLRSVKTNVRAVSRGGLTYGLLRYSRRSPAGSPVLGLRSRGQVSFNYLGQIDLALSAGGPFQPAVEPTGQERAGDTPRAYLIDVVAMISGGQLQVQWLYSGQMHRRTTVQKLAERFAHELEAILTESGTEPFRAAIPSDFPLVTLTETEVTRLLETSPPVVDIWPLTPLQEGMLVHTLHDDQPGAYTQQVSVDLSGDLNLQAFREAWSAMAQRFPVLRGEFYSDDLPRPVQAVRRELPVEVAVLNWMELSPAALKTRWVEWLAQDRSRGFNLAQAPLWRVVLLQLAPNRWRMIWSHHHLLLDGWSLPIIFRDLLSVYQAYTENAPVPASNTFAFRRYLQWLAGRQVSEEESFWKSYLAGYRRDGPLAIGAPPVSPDSPALARHSVHRVLDSASTRALRTVSQDLQVTLGSCLTAAWGIALLRWTRTDDLVFGSVVSGRTPELPGIESAVGMFINTIPLRVRHSLSQGLGDWIKQLHNQSATLRQYEHSRLMDVQSWSGLPRGQQLFDALLIIENYPVSGLLDDPVKNLKLEDVSTFEQTNLPLNLYLAPRGDQIEIRLDYATNSFTHEAMDGLADSLLWLLEAMPSSVDRRLPAIGLVNPQALRPSAAHDAELPPSSFHPSTFEGSTDFQPTHVRFSERATLHPEKTAIRFFNEQLTYSELEEKANRLARHLQALGAGRGHLVGIYLERSPNLLVALLGVLKAGAAYVPLDPGFPPERLAFMICDSGLGFAITGPATEVPQGLFPESVLRTELGPEFFSAAPSLHPAPSAVSPSDLAYVIFTSGSTGRPKGVQVTHGGLANFLLHFAQSPGLQPEDTLLAVTTLSFDIAGLELFLPLLTGATVAIATREVAADPRQLVRAIESENVTVMQATPATWRLLLSADWQPPASFRAWCGGEALPTDLAKELLSRGVDLWNFYGPTETTIWSTTQHVQLQEDAASIGGPISNTNTYVLDSYLNPVPEGVAGELYIGGDGLAQGYINRPDLTAERFVPDPFSPGGRLYATGDFVRREHNGSLRFLGRGDQQVKIRGFRIELEDVASAIRTMPHVIDACVDVRKTEGGDLRLAAWVVGLTASGGAAALRSYLRDRLPDYMIPNAYMELPALPRTLNGKLDRKALPELTSSERAPSDTVAPRNALEQVLASLWSELLGIPGVGANGHFFELGGHSLLAAQALARIRKYFQIELSLRTFFSTATPATVAEALIAKEPSPGHALKIAGALLKLRSMSPEEKARLRQRQAAT